MKNRNRQKIYLFLFVFVFSFFQTKITGTIGRGFHGPISFEETLNYIPQMIFIALFIVIIYSVLTKNK